MKKLLFIIGLFFPLFLFSQKQPIGFGIKGGVNFPNYHLSNVPAETDFRTTFHVSAFVEVPILTEYLYAQPAVSLQGKGAKGVYAFGFAFPLIDVAGPLDYQQRTMWLEIPLNVVAKVPTGRVGHFFIGTGPYVAFGLSGEHDTRNTLDLRDFKFGKDNDLKRMDFGLNFIAGYQLSNGLMVHGGYGLGLTDLSTSLTSGRTGSETRQTNRVWTVGVGYMFK